MRPKSNGSSTIGMKKSVVAITQFSSSSCQTAASSPVSVPTRSWLKGCMIGWSDSRSCKTAGASLQPQPPPWASVLRRIGDAISMIPPELYGYLARGHGVAETVRIEAIQPGARDFGLRIHEEAEFGSLSRRQGDIAAVVEGDPVALPRTEQLLPHGGDARIVGGKPVLFLFQHHLAHIRRIGRHPADAVEIDFGAAMLGLGDDFVLRAEALVTEGGRCNAHAI